MMFEMFRTHHDKREGVAHAESVSVANTEGAKESPVYDIEVPDSFDPIAFLHHSRVDIGPQERDTLVGLITNFGADPELAGEHAALRATDFESVSDGSREERFVRMQLAERLHGAVLHGSFRAALFLANQYLDGSSDGAPLLLDGTTRNIIFNIRDGVGMSLEMERDWHEPEDGTKDRIAINLWGAEHGALMFNDKVRFITSDQQR